MVDRAAPLASDLSFFVELDAQKLIKRRMWVRNWWRRRNTKRVHHNLPLELRLEDEYGQAPLRTLWTGHL